MLSVKLLRYGRFEGGFPFYPQAAGHHAWAWLHTLSTLRYVDAILIDFLYP